jgi:hypothetical protein
MKTKIFLLATLLSTVNLIAQDVLDTRNNLKSFQNFNGISQNGVWILGKPLENKIEGSIYLFSNWNGMFKIKPKEGSEKQIFNLNYNLKTKTLESYVSNDSVFQFDLDKIEYISQSDKKYKVLENNDLKGLVLEIFNSENIKLYKEFQISVSSGVFNPLTQQKMEEDKFVQNYKYHLFLNGNHEIIKLGKSDILNHLSDKKNELKDFVSKNNLSYNKDEDVKKILQFYSVSKQ